MGNRPSKTNWHYTGWYDEEYGVAWDGGYAAAQQGLSLDDNPYPPSGHERDTTRDDELGYWWYSGFCEYGDPEED